MAEETPPVDEMHYDALAQDALRGVIRLALERAAMPEGIPGAHHFYITFKTRAAGVSVPPALHMTQIGWAARNDALAFCQRDP